jgi:hypothetical protein
MWALMTNLQPFARSASQGKFAFSFYPFDKLIHGTMGGIGAEPLLKKP